MPEVVNHLGQIVRIEVEYNDGSTEVYNTAGSDIARQECHDSLAELD